MLLVLSAHCCLSITAGTRGGATGGLLKKGKKIKIKINAFTAWPSLHSARFCVACSLQYDRAMWILTVKCFACPAGELDCQVCAMVRGGLIGAVVGGLYPIFMAIPVNGSLAARYVLSICSELHLVIFPALSLNCVNF